MRKRIIIPTLLALIVGLGLFGVYSLSTLSAQPVTEATVQPQSKYDVGPPDAQELLELVNAERAKVGVAPLVIDERLNKSAQRKSDEMYTNNNTTHVDKDGVHGYMYIVQAEVQCKYISENIAYWLDNSRQVMNAWMNSKPHREALLDGKYATTGIAVTNWAVAQHFCQI